jgi:hypothetical protein
VSDDDLTAAYLAGYHKAEADIKQLKAQNAKLVEALERIYNMGVPVQKEEHRVARAAITKAKGNRDE